ncbi:MAG: universal stress protein UspA [Nitrospiraceae bacterium]|nr:universal stress protein UspA [Nitrospiraceae bacterium]|tara:strand:+ start:1948 stop:3924 length:1977 start_codon:yes stop_codon:yes gene_type:complete
MYKSIYVPVDNSDHSNAALDIGVSLAKTFGGKVVGSHVYAAKMHDRRFKQMEAGLPEEYQGEKELERQRQIHDSLITRGLEIISDSYMDVVTKKCGDANVPHETLGLEGRNFKVLVEDINTNKYDLSIIGSLGLGAVKDSVIGSVCERVVRRVRTSDVLVVKDTAPMNGGSIVVAVDGSPLSFGGLKTGIALGKALNKPVEAIAAFDPYFHYAAFHSISGVLSEEAGKVFRFKEQEKLHEEIIDSGLAKIYQSHLDVSRDVAQEDGADIKTTLLDGKAFEKILRYARQVNPWLLIVGRIGIHSDDEMDIGSNTENLLRSLPCNVLVSNRAFIPPVDTQAEYTMAWSEEALRRMEKIPIFARGVAKTAIHRYAIEKGYTIISNSVVDEAIGTILPKSALDSMRALGETLDKQDIDRNTMQGDDSVAKDLMENTLSGMMAGVVEESGGETKARDYYVCKNCGHIGKGAKPVTCPVCPASGDSFELVDKAIFEAAAEVEGNIESEYAYDDVAIQWTSTAKQAIRTVPAGYQRRRCKAQIEKSARKLGMTTITEKYAGPMIAEAIASPSSRESTTPQASPQANTSSPCIWTDSAKARIERVPEGYMRDCTRALVEKYAKENGITNITLDVATIGIDQGKVTMEKAMKTGNVKEVIDQILKLE